jgi:conjugative relaxase-like TrwC/TraI family protein
MIHPRRLKGKSGNIGRYYSVGDYYTKGTDEHSEWGGKIASELGLEGKVDPDTFEQLLGGKVGDKQLGRRRANGEIQHHPGWDFAVNAPKSVSIMALVAGDERIIAAHENAVGVALDYLEEHAAFRRRSDGKVVQETTGRLIYARFTEHASRELDPHLHTHVVVMNITNQGDGMAMTSLETRAMFAEQMVAGQVYRNELAHHLREAGYGVEFDPRTGLFEITGVPKDLVTAMSQRAEEINEHAKEHGLSGQAARRRSFYETRPPKEKVSLESLRQQWGQRAGAHRSTLTDMRKAAETQETELAPDARTSARAMLFGIRQGETREAVNNLGRLLRYGLASHVGEVRLLDIRPLADAHQVRAKLLATHEPTGDEVHTRGRTTRRTARLEIALADHLALALNDAPPVSSPDKLKATIAEAGLNPAQEAALLHIGTTKDRVVGVQGVAGAGKSTLVKALVDSAEPNMTLIALAPTSSAAANLGGMAKIESRTVASLLAGGGRTLTDDHVLILDEAGQLGNRYALRLLEISRLSGARLVLLGDDKQTGAIEQGKPFWLLQQLGLSTAQLNESVRQATRQMKAAVVQARLGNYDASLDNLDKVVSADSADKLAKDLVREWTHLKPENRANTNILVLENATRLIVNSEIRRALKTEGAVAAEETRLSVLTPAGMSAEERRFARFYSGGQVVIFSRDVAGTGFARDMEYRVVGISRGRTGRQMVELVDENGRIDLWDPRIGRVSQVNVFKREERDLARGDRIQWRLVNEQIGLKNAERGTVEALQGSVATIRWDREGRVQKVDLGKHKNWDHGYAETVYSAQSKTYDRVYVLAPVGSSLVTGQNYYTAITRARFGVKLWTEDREALVDRLERRSGEKTSALEGLGQLSRSQHLARARHHGERWARMRREQQAGRRERKERIRSEREARDRPFEARSIGEVLAERARMATSAIDQWLESILSRGSGEARSPQAGFAQAESSRGEGPQSHDRGAGPER